MNRVLVRFDGSEGAVNALNKAMMFIDDDGELIILAIISLPSDKNLLDQMTYESIKSRAHNLINNVIHDIGLHDYTITGMVKEGEDIAAVIIDIAKGHFRVEHHMPDGEARRDDGNFCYVAAWEFGGPEKKPHLHKEPLIFENVQLATRSYK